MRRSTIGLALSCFCVLATGCVNITFNNRAAKRPRGTQSLPDQQQVADAPPGFSPNNPMFRFDGTWIGTLQNYVAPYFMNGKGHPFTFCIFIGPYKQAKLFKWDNDQWKPFGNDRTFYEISWGPQAVVQSLGSGQDEDGTWVEGLQFKFVRQDANTAIVYWLRTVNNLNMPSTAKWHNFAYGYNGRMRRVATGDGPACIVTPAAKQ